MPWKRHRYRENKVWIHIDDAGAPVLDDRGLAELRYKPEDERAYTVRPGDLAELAEPEPIRADPPPPPIRLVLCLAPTHEQEGSDPQYAYGAALAWRDHRRVLGGHVSGATRSQAEVEALLAALRQVKRPELGVVARGTEALAEMTASDEAASAAGLSEPAQHALQRARAHFASLRIEAFAPSDARARAAAQDHADARWRRGSPGGR